MIDSKSIVLCADDFGFSPGVCKGILKLVNKDRLSAVSCMTNLPDFILYADQLLSSKNRVQIGLHFNLTEGQFLSIPGRKCFTRNELLIKSHMHSIKLSLIAQEFAAQLEQFVQVMQQLPDFIDGHQHVHQYPVIRKVILDLYKKKLKDNGTFIRSTWPSITGPYYRLKAKLLELTGGHTLHEQLISFKIPHNCYFSGVYDFSPQADYRTLFQNWLSLAPDNTLFMCHPGEEICPDDSIAKARTKEFAYFLSDAFLTDCEEHQVSLFRNFMGSN